jgi:acyl carrier protein
VGGAGVARGYLNQTGLTEMKFINHPLGKGGKLYRSGDFARILPSGDIEYIGRKDEQLKIRGHRIETGEIETTIRKLEGIRDVIVVPLKNTEGEYELIAYYISDEEPDQLRLPDRLRHLLPVYMVPSFFIPLVAFPLNKSGKLDKKALPVPDRTFHRKNGYVAGRNEIDTQIIAIWESILERDTIGIRDNFFDLGGHSLKAARVISRLQESFGIKIDLKNLFIDPTIEHLSDYISTVQWMAGGNGILAGEDGEMTF